MISNKMGRPVSQRQLRVGEMIKQSLGMIFLKNEAKVPNLETNKITVTEVKMSQDLKIAKAFVLPLGGENADETTGIEIVKRSVEEPLRQIVANGGNEGAVIVQKVKEGKDEWLVMLGVCTHLGCVPLKDKGDYKGWFCPCHGSHYDVSGRIRKGPAPKNMEIPKFEFVDANTIKIG